MNRPLAITCILLFIICACHPHKVTKHLFVNDRIFDSAQLLSSVQRDSIFQIINKLDSSIGSQIGVNIISSLRGRNISAYSLDVAQKLRLGRTSYNDGILLTVALAEHQMRIEVGTGLENIIKDEIASRINRNILAPQFRMGNFGRGIYLGLDSIKFLIERDKELVGVTR
ncbi:MAG: TPM domain-containing protein [Bacteroidetes bacterium]|nr:TPM domain-containing protein [Bacteroidota bacterium]